MQKVKYIRNAFSDPKLVDSDEEKYEPEQDEEDIKTEDIEYGEEDPEITNCITMQNPAEEALEKCRLRKKIQKINIQKDANK